MHRRSAVLASFVVLFAAWKSDCLAGIFQLDFAVSVGAAEDWDIIDPINADEECDYQGGPTPCTIFSLTDQTGIDTDATLEILEVPFIGNTAPYVTDPQVYDGIEIPEEAIGDYQYRNPDTAGTSAPFRFDNLSPGEYRVTVFEGRTTDANGQFAKIWVGDADGSNEPGVPGEHGGQNTGDFAASSATVELTVGDGQYLWYRHLEDSSGGISGMIIRQLGGIDDLPGDFNADGSIDLLDFHVMADHFNTEGEFADGDMNYSGVIDIADFVEFRVLYNSQPQAVVPEPASACIALLAFATLVCAARWRKAPGEGLR